jgi:hypothetical protein
MPLDFAHVKKDAGCGDEISIALIWPVARGVDLGGSGARGAALGSTGAAPIKEA